MLLPERLRVVIRCKFHLRIQANSEHYQITMIIERRRLGLFYERSRASMHRVATLRVAADCFIRLLQTEGGKAT